MEQQVKSKQRVADHGEVFTAEREVKAMCDLVKQETERIDSRFLEPACGDGNGHKEVPPQRLRLGTERASGPQQSLWRGHPERQLRHLPRTAAGDLGKGIPQRVQTGMQR